MCDTLFVPRSSSAEHVTLFGKNSDRQRNEAQAIEYSAAADHVPGSQRKCTYITIPQIAHTHATLVSRPVWMWGAEMGANEFGVVIGNEGLHARSLAPQEPALTGMDLLRLTLERARTALDAVDVLTTLLERHGQGGNCGHMTPNYYNNGFLIADAVDGYVVETLGREWLVERASGPRTLSNVYSIGDRTIRVSQGLHTLIQSQGWSSNPAPSYAEVIADPNREHIGHARARLSRSRALLAMREGALTTADMMRVLRDHGEMRAEDRAWTPEFSPHISVCMHAGGEERSGQTVGSWVSELRPEGAVHWVTATAAPCISVFKPLFIDAEVPSEHVPLTDRYDPDTLWWKHERFHRAALRGDFAKRIEEIRDARDQLEATFERRVRAVQAGGSRADRSRVVAQCWQEAAALEGEWDPGAMAATAPRNTPYWAEWSKLNQAAGIDL